jgi:tRNA U34 2-thiouridine synthase MnmA/TrmU
MVQPLSSFNWIAGEPPAGLQALLQRHSKGGEQDACKEGEPRVFRCEHKSRYNQQPTPCSIEILTRNSEVMLKISFNTPQHAITPGQILALYDGDICLGGGVIAKQPLFVGKERRPVHL